MEVIPLQLFVSLMLVVGSVLLFLKVCSDRTFDHSDRLSLLPIEEEKNTNNLRHEVRSASQSSVEQKHS
ncbi:MAG: hypothetical protein U0174_03180 [Polyangiaceae bacterium]